MGYYDDYLEHGIKGWSKKNHKYIKREWRNGRFVYYYKKADPKHENGFTYTNKDDPEMQKWTNAGSYSRYFDRYRSDYDETKKHYLESINKYGGELITYAGMNDSPTGAIRESIENNLIKGDVKNAYQDARYSRKIKESSAKAKLGSVVLSLTNGKNYLKMKVKDLFTPKETVTVSSNLYPAGTKKVIKK